MSLLSLTLSYLRLLRHAGGDRPMVNKIETFVVCCHGDVLCRREQYSHVIVYVREQCCHMDSERVVSNDR